MTLISPIIESYSSILLTISLVAFVIFSLGLYWIVRSARDEEARANAAYAPMRFKSGRSEKFILPDTANDVSEIAGDDPMATQMDLARAYIETDKKQFARIILTAVIREGSTIHQEEAQRLLGSI